MNETAIVAGGCFWCTEAVFKELRGVESVMPGYTGGTVPHPTYEQVCTGTTGHAEAIRIVFDPSQIAYRDLLTVFFATHDPTTPDRQGNDVGPQYRSAIFFTSPQQEQEAREFIRELETSDPGGKPVVTEVVPWDGHFYDAEDYHRDYFAKNPDAGYCRVIIEPKVEKLQKQFSALLRKQGKE
jgi:peptide-methionine (S)-S-oxide reductase